MKNNLNIPKLKTNRRSSEKQVKYLQGVFDELYKGLYQPKNAQWVKAFIAQFLKAKKLDAYSEKKIRTYIFKESCLKTLPIEWNPATKRFRTIRSTNDDPDPLEVGQAFFDKSYFCCGSAIYWNQLTNQVPSHFYIVKERAQRVISNAIRKLDHHSIRDQFLRSQRETHKIAQYKGFRFTLLERNATGNLGIISKTVQGPKSEVTINLTDIERTLIDAAIYPQYSGGVLNVIQAFRSASEVISISKLITYYETLKFQYAYWQRIGFILSQSVDIKKITMWRNHFGTPKYDFYLDRPYKADWIMDLDWRVYYQEGIL